MDLMGIHTECVIASTQAHYTAVWASEKARWHVKLLLLHVKNVYVCDVHFPWRQQSWKVAAKIVMYVIGLYTALAKSDFVHVGQ